MGVRFGCPHAPPLPIASLANAIHHIIHAAVFPSTETFSLKDRNYFPREIRGPAKWVKTLSLCGTERQRNISVFNMQTKCGQVPTLRLKFPTLVAQVGL